MQEWVYTCELCGGTLQPQHGQLVCPNCGRCLDCCDLSALPADAPPSALASPPAPREEGDAGANSWGLAAPRSELVLHGQPHWFDPMAVTDAPTPAGTLELLRTGASTLWLIPRAEPGKQPEEPFSFLLYGIPLYDAAFRAEFLRGYEKRGQTRWYDLWFYKGGTR